MIWSWPFAGFGQRFLSSRGQRAGTGKCCGSSLRPLPSYLLVCTGPFTEGPRRVKSTGGQGHFLGSTRGQIYFLESTRDMGVEWQGTTFFNVIPYRPFRVACHSADTQLFPLTSPLFPLMSYLWLIGSNNHRYLHTIGRLCSQSTQYKISAMISTCWIVVLFEWVNGNCEVCAACGAPTFGTEN